MRFAAPRPTTSSVRGTRTGRLWTRLPVLLAITMILLLPPQSSRAAESTFAWPQFGFDEQHSGVNPLETTISPANVHSLKRLYRVPLVSATSPSTSDGSPAFLGGVNINGTNTDLLFVTTRDGWTLALDAHTGK